MKSLSRGSTIPCRIKPWSPGTPEEEPWDVKSKWTERKTWKSWQLWHCWKNILRHLHGLTWKWLKLVESWLQGRIIPTRLEDQTPWCDDQPFPNCFCCLSSAALALRIWDTRLSLRKSKNASTRLPISTVCACGTQLPKWIDVLFAWSQKFWGPAGTAKDHIDDNASECRPNINTWWSATLKPEAHSPIQPGHQKSWSHRLTTVKASAVPKKGIAAEPNWDVGFRWMLG